jgi:hypothetical protein
MAYYPMRTAQDTLSPETTTEAVVAYEQPESNAGSAKSQSEAATNGPSWNAVGLGAGQSSRVCKDASQTIRESQGHCEEFADIGASMRPAS